MNFQNIYRVFLAVAICAFSMSTFAQSDKVDITWGEEISIKDGYVRKLAGQTNGHIYHLLRQKSTWYIQKKNMDLILTGKEKLDLKKGDKELSMNDVVVFHDHYLLFASHYTRGEHGKHELYLKLGDSNTLEPHSGAEKLSTTKDKYKVERIAFDHDISPDGSKLLVYYQTPYEDAQGEKIGLKVFDADMQIIWEGEVDLPYTDPFYVTERVSVMNDGTALVSGIRNRTEHNPGRYPYKYELLLYKNAQEAPLVIEAEYNDWFLRDMQIGVAKDGNIMCSGFYAKPNASLICGAYYIKYDRNTGAVMHQSHKEFDEGFMASYRFDKDENKGYTFENGAGNIMWTYILSDITLRDDGSAVLIAEQYFTISYSESSGNSTYTVTEYTYNDVFVVNMNSTGDIDWVQKIPKRQFTRQGYLYSSYGFIIEQDKLYLIYNDNAKNLELEEGKDPKNFDGKKSHRVVLCTIDPNGGLEREVLLSDDEAEVLIAPTASIQIDDQWFIYGQEKKNYRFGRLDFK